jgi:uncharacterized membrane protein
MNRFKSIDVVRGLVMIIMALDHVRELMHVSALTQSPTDLTTTTPILFFTRWITYLCAPVFVFLSGTSAYLSLQKKKNIAASRFYMIKRGLWLMLFDLIVMNFILYFDVQFHTVLFSVLACIGFGFILLGVLFQLPTKLLGVIGLGIIITHGLYGMYTTELNDITQSVLNPLLTLSVIPLSAGKLFIVAYPPLPWFGIMLLGFSFGKMILSDFGKRDRQLVLIGLSTIACFLFIRLLNGYGDQQPWSVQKDLLTTLLSFFNVSKYPPSLLFSLITLGIMFLLWGVAKRFNPLLQNTLSVYGKVPLFYYVIHFLLIHLITLVVLRWQGIAFADLNFATSTFGRPTDQLTGVGLSTIFVIWIFVVALLYLPCKWYWKYKQTHQNLLTTYF